MQATSSIVLLLIFIAVYLAPSAVAFRRGHPRRWVILLVNAALGWTIVGWVVAWGWTLGRSAARATPKSVEAGSTCPACGAAFDPRSYRRDAPETLCSACGHALNILQEEREELADLPDRESEMAAGTPPVPAIRAIGAGAVAGLAAGLIAHYAHDGRMSLGIFLIVSILFLSGLKGLEKIWGLIAFVAAGSLVVTLLGHLPR